MSIDKFDKKRMGELAGLVKYHSDLYYNKATPELTDALSLTDVFAARRRLSITSRYPEGPCR